MEVHFAWLLYAHIEKVNEIAADEIRLLLFHKMKVHSKHGAERQRKQIDHTIKHAQRDSSGKKQLKKRRFECYCFKRCCTDNKGSRLKHPHPYTGIE